MDVNTYLDTEELIPGNSLSIKHSIYYRENEGDLSQYLPIPREELEEKRTQSTAEEQALFNSIKEAVHKWAEQAANTLRLDMAIQYLKTPVVSHTSNKWVKNQYGELEISNMVYRMYYRVREETRYNRTTERMERNGWGLSWYLLLNSHSQYRCTIAGQRDKWFADETRLNQYVQGRFKAYSRLFQEISPPIPQEHIEKFKVNGCLLPGYTAEKPETLRHPPARGQTHER